MFSLEDTARAQLNYKLLLPSAHFELLVARDQQVRRMTILAWLINSDQQREVRLILHNGNGEAYVRNSGDTHGCFSVLAFPLSNFNVDM